MSAMADETKMGQLDNIGELRHRVSKLVHAVLTLPDAGALHASRNFCGWFTRMDLPYGEHGEAPPKVVDKSAR